jgi:hypothetical protein
MSEMSREEVLRKVRGLLRLTSESGATEHETEVAVGKVQALLLRYHLDASEIEEKEEEVVHEEFKMGSNGYNQPYQWLITLSQAVAETSLCQCLFVTGARRLIFIGKTTDVAIARDLYQFLRDQIVDLSERASRAPDQFEHRARFKSGFLIGCTARVAQRLAASFQQSVREADETYSQTSSIGSATALVRVSNAVVETYKDRVFTKTRIVNVGIHTLGNAGGRRAQSAGYRAGDKVKLSRDKELAEELALAGGK